MFAEVSDMSRSESLRLIPVLLAALLAGNAGSAAEPERWQKVDEPSPEQLESRLEAARDRLDQAAREVAELSMSLSHDFAPNVTRYMRSGMQRVMLGINLGRGRDGRDERDEGVEVVSVSPGGPADDAGLKAGDVLVEINGKPLKREGEASPRGKLMAALREVEPGEKVAVSYRRVGKQAKVDVIAQPVMQAALSLARPSASTRHLPTFVFGRAAGAFGSAELVPLTPKLGQYFGTETGLLVVRAPADGRLKLEDGDVILDIDGRKPSSPAHALQILASYQAGEKLKLNVLRAKKPMSIDIAVPEDPVPGADLREHRWGFGGPEAGGVIMRDHTVMATPIPPAGMDVPPPPPPPPPPGAI
jgi:S1-C subfamily serine protease